MGGRARRRAIALLLISVILAATACTRPKPKEAETTISQAEKVLPAIQPTPEQTVVSVQETVTPLPTPTHEVPAVPLPTASPTSLPTVVLTPTPEEAPAPPESSTTHIVQPGETLFSLGQKYGVSWLEIAQANRIGYPYWIMVGQKLTIPPGGAPVAPTSERIHVVQPGENLFRIGLKYGVSWQAVARANGIANANQIFVGQKLVIP